MRFQFVLFLFLNCLKVYSLFETAIHAFLNNLISSFYEFLLNPALDYHFIIFTGYTQMFTNQKIIVILFAFLLFVPSQAILGIGLKLLHKALNVLPVIGKKDWNKYSRGIDTLPHEVPLDILVHLQHYGDRHGNENQWVGTKGESKRLQGFSIRKDFNHIQVNLQYMAHLEGIGDTGFVHENSFIGTRGQSRRLQGFAIKLVGAFAQFYDIFYQCHLQGIGDTHEYRNGQFCGTRGESRRVQAIKVRMVRNSINWFPH